MSAADWVVLALGAAAIAWVNWYFFHGSGSGERRGTGEGSEEGHHHG